MPSCRAFTAKAGDYAGHNLPLTQHLAFRFHLLMCHECRRYLRQHRVAQLVIGGRTAPPLHR